MAKTPERRLREFRKVFHRSIPENYDLTYIEIPNSHPDPDKAIYLFEKLKRAINSEDIFGNFVSKFKKLGLIDQYYFGVYYQSLSTSSLYQENYIYRKLYQNYFEHEKAQKGYLPNPYLKDFISKNKEIVRLDTFVANQLDKIAPEVRAIFIQPSEDNYSFIVNSGEDIELNDFQIDISAAYTKFQYEVREILGTSLSSQNIDLFIHNSFKFPGNKIIPSILSLDYGESQEMGRDFHLMFKAHNKIVESPRVEKYNFALLMYCTFEYVRQNWITLKSSENSSLHNFIKTSVTSYIRS